MKGNNMNLREKCKQLRFELDAILPTVGKKIGLGITCGRMVYRPDEGTITVKLEATAPNEKGQIEPKEAIDFKACCWQWNLKPEDLGKSFEFQGKTFQLVGAKPRSHRFPLLGKCASNGKTFKFEARQVANQLYPAQKILRQGGRTEAEIIKDLQRVECDLSPENLFGDGEIPRSVANRHQAELNRERRRLVEELGREPTDTELYGLAIK
jgi:hypothetical protein